MKKSIAQLLAFGVPKTKIARQVGITRQDLYAFLSPVDYPERSLGEETIRKIADFEGRSMRAVRGEYEQKAS